MDKASASGAGDCGFESHLGRTNIYFAGTKKRMDNMKSIVSRTTENFKSYAGLLNKRPVF